MSSNDQSELPRAQSSASHRARAEEIKRKAVERHRRSVETARVLGPAGRDEPVDKALKRLASAPRKRS